MSKKHVFLSYCHDDSDAVRQLHDDLAREGEPVWWDEDILPGQDWKLAIRRAMKDAYAVVACLSQAIGKRDRSGVFPELRDAIGEYRLYPPGSIFLIPVRLDDCDVPDLEIDATTVPWSFGARSWTSGSGKRRSPPTRERGSVSRSGSKRRRRRSASSAAGNRPRTASTPLY